MGAPPIAAPRHRAVPARASAEYPPSFRPDIAGLRAVAVVAVVLFHAGVPGLSGGFVGVDVFFVISGFLVTTMLVGEHARTGTVRLAAFYARRIRRLLPMAFVVLAATLATAKLFVPPLLLPPISHVARSVAVYLTNVRLASDGTNYLADDSPSPLQHYWSLAVEEQFYLLAPVALLFVLRYARRHLLAAVAAGTALSFAACVVRVGQNQPAAFFGLPYRAWELGVGAVCALLLLRGRVPGPRAAWWGSRLGLVAVAAAVVLLTPAVTYPGVATVLPVLGTGAVLLAGDRSDRGPGVLRPAAVQWLGQISYSLYLWHWPLLVLPVLVTGDALTGPQRAGVVVAAVALAGVSERWIERPFRLLRSRPGRTIGAAAGVTLVAAGASVALAVLPTLATTTTLPTPTPAALARGVEGAPVVPANVTPSLETLAADLPVVYRDGCHQGLRETTPGPSCGFGAPASPRRVMLLGDSHAAQWFPALEQAAAERGWALTSLSKSTCPFVDGVVVSTALKRPFAECETWKQRALDRVWTERPALVVLAAHSPAYRALLVATTDFDRDWAAAQGRMIGRLPPGTRSVVLGDSPQWPRSPGVCLSGSVTDAAACARPAADLIDAPLARGEETEAEAAGGRFVPTVPWVCGATCPVVMGNVVVYRDDHHVTATFSRLLAARVGREVLDPALG